MAQNESESIALELVSKFRNIPHVIESVFSYLKRKDLKRLSTLSLELEHWSEFMIKKKDDKFVKLLVAKGCNVNHDNWKKLLREACRRNNMEMINMFLDNDAYVKLDKHWPIYISAQNGHFLTVKHLLKNGHDDVYGKECQGVLTEMSKSVNAMSYLISKGANVNDTNLSGYSALHEASFYGNAKAVEFLIHKGANVELTDGYGKRPLHNAARYGTFKVFQLLVKLGKADLHALDNDDFSAFHCAAASWKCDNIKIMEYLWKVGANVEQVDKRGLRPLHIAAQQGELKSVKWLLNVAKADLHSIDKEGNSALWYASYDTNIGVMKLLVESGANVEQSNKKGLRPIHQAAHYGRHENVKWLLNVAKADLNVSDKNGRFPLWHASYDGNPDLIKFLLNNEANVEQGDNEGLRPIHIAAHQGHYEAVKLLLEVGKADLHSMDNNESSILWHASHGKNIGVMKLLIENNVNDMTANRKGSTPLLIAAERGKIEAVKLLLRNGASVNHADKMGCSSFWYASYNAHTDMMKLLLESGANVEQVGRYSKTPLHAAVDRWTKENADAVKVLLEAGADVKQRNYLGLRPLDIAAKRGRLDIVKLLIEVGKADPKSRCYSSLYFGRTTKSFAKSHKDIVEYLEKSISEKSCKSEKYLCKYSYCVLL